MSRFIPILISCLLFFKVVVPGYIYTGIRWSKDRIPVAYYLNNNNPNGLGNSAVNAINAGFQTWSNTSGQYLRFNYSGAITRTVALDNFNVVCWGTVFNDPPDGGSLAVTGTWYDTRTNLVEEVDLEFNSTLAWFTTGLDYDLQTVALHEAGHWLVLDDIYDPAFSSSIMFGFYQGLRRSLSPDDISGIRFIYPQDLESNLLQNAPNPFKPRTSEDFTLIGFELTQDTHVLLRIYNLAGELVKTLVDTDLKAGVNAFKWYGDNGDPDGRGQSVGSGVYIYVLKTDNSATKKGKLMLIR